MSYKLRITTSDFSLVTELCEKYFSSYMVSTEEQGESGRPHYHLYLKFSQGVKEAAVRAGIRKRFKSDGNKVYSLKELDEEYPLEYIAYLQKEGVSLSVNVPEEIIQQAKEYDEKVKSEIKKVKKAKRQTQLEQIDEAYFGDIDPDTHLNEEGCYLTKEEIVDRVVKYYQETGKLVRMFAMVSISQTLCLKYVPSYDRSLSSKIFDSM